MGDDGEEDVYLVRREAGDDAVPVARSRLRHRVIVKQCHPVISDDKTRTPCSASSPRSSST